MAGGGKIDVKKLRRAVLDYEKSNPGIKRRGLSMKASDGRNPDVIRDLFRVDKRQPQYETVAGIANAIGRDPQEFVAGATARARDEEYWLTVSSAVEAGAFRRHPDWPVDEWYQVLVDPPEDDCEHHGVIVRGRSMDRIFPPGTILDCVPTIGSGVAFEPDDYVIVECRQGDLVETTVKKAVLRDDGNWELRAESFQPEFAEPIFIGKPTDGGFDAIEHNETRVKAIVMDAHLPLKRRKTRPLPSSG